MALLGKRENELTKIYQYAGRGFFASYLAGVGTYYFLKGRTPFFRDIAKHSILSVGGMFAAALLAERLASELYYNRLLI
jgi:hypothetical protein